ncbi:MAG: putative metalloprotease CJM1_0395 family protein [Gammaproteobacteria bacterium]
MQPSLIRFQPTLTGAYPQLRPAPKIESEEASNKTEPAHTPTPSTAQTEKLSLEEQRQIQVLKTRDGEVRAHEQAHLNAAGGFATGGASFTFQTGPDGKRYAVGGEVHIDTSPIPGDPEATLSKAETIRRAALAPASPSSQDFSVAASAAGLALNARIDLLKANQQNSEMIGTQIDFRV